MLPPSIHLTNVYSLCPQVILPVTSIPVLGVTFFLFLLYIFWAIATLI